MHDLTSILEFSGTTVCPSIMYLIFQDMYSFVVKLVDYGNEVTCYHDQLRKDLVGLDVNILTLEVQLDNIKLTGAYQEGLVYDKFAYMKVDVELTEYPEKLPLKCNLHLTDANDDIGNILVSLRMARDK